MMNKSIDLIKNYIKSVIKEDYHTKSHTIPNNNSLYSTLDSGNINYELKINKYYIIDQYCDYKENFTKNILNIRVRKTCKELFIKKGLSIDSINYESNDENIFENEKRNIIDKLYTEMCNVGIT